MAEEATSSSWSFSWGQHCSTACFSAANRSWTAFPTRIDDVRYQAFKGALAIFRQFPLFGSGMGTFGDLFYQYQPASLKDWYFLQTHSDWLQLLAETGISWILPGGYGLGGLLFEF